MVTYQHEIFMFLLVHETHFSLKVGVHAQHQAKAEAIGQKALMTDKLLRLRMSLVLINVLNV